MTVQPATRPGPAELEAALVLLSRLGITAADLQQAAPTRPPAPTFAEYVPVVSAAVGPGTRRIYSSYWNRIVEHWGTRRLDEPTPSEIERLTEQVKANAVQRRNTRGGRLPAEHLIAAMRCVYRHAIQDGLLDEAQNPAGKVAKPRRLPRHRLWGKVVEMAGPERAACPGRDRSPFSTLWTRTHVCPYSNCVLRTGQGGQRPRLLIRVGDGAGDLLGTVWSPAAATAGARSVRTRACRSGSVSNRAV